MKKRVPIYLFHREMAEAASHFGTPSRLGLLIGVVGFGIGVAMMMDSRPSSPPKRQVTWARGSELETESTGGEEELEAPMEDDSGSETGSDASSEPDGEPEGAVGDPVEERPREQEEPPPARARNAVVKSHSEASLESVPLDSNPPSDEEEDTVVVLREDDLSRMLPGEDYASWYRRYKRVQEKEAAAGKRPTDAYLGPGDAASKKVYLARQAYRQARKQHPIMPQA